MARATVDGCDVVDCYHAAKEAIDRALKTVRSRIEGIGVSESVVQKQGDDRIVPTERGAALEGRPGVTRRVYPGLRHELHNESDGPRIEAEVIAWIRERVSRPHGPS